MRAQLCKISVDWVDPKRQVVAQRALERLKGLRLCPHEILLDPPVIIARKVSIENAKEVKNFLERNGVAVTLEPEISHPGESRTPPGTRRTRLREEMLVQQICTHLATKVPGFVAGAMKKGLTSLGSSVWKAGLGLFLGVLLGGTLAFLFSAYYASHARVELELLPKTTIYLYMLVTHGVCGMAIGWWTGLKKSLKEAVLGNEAVLDLVDATVGNICRFLEANGLTTEGRKQFLSSLQGRINGERSRISRAIQGRLKRVALMRGISYGIAVKILDASCRVPEMILLNMDMTPREGSGQRTMLVEGFFSRLDQVFGTAVDSAFSRPFAILLVVMGILAALPFATLLAQTNGWY